MQVLVGIQARSSSTRFPRKAFALIGDRPVLGHVIDQCRKVKVAHQLAVLCPNGDQEIWDFCKKESVLCFQGHPTDLVTRYWDAMVHFAADAAVRVTGDCWNINPERIEEVIQALEKVDYASNCIVRSFREGDDCQGVSRRAMSLLNSLMGNDREHPFRELDANEVHRQWFTSSGYKWKALVNPDNIIFQHNSIDTVEDLRRAQRQYEE